MTRNEFFGRMKSEVGVDGVRRDHSLGAGVELIGECGGSIVADRAGVDGRRLVTYRVPTSDGRGEVLATWGHPGVIYARGVTLPPTWRFV